LESSNEREAQVKELLRYQGATPVAAAVYRPAGVGLAGMTLPDLGINTYLVDLESLRGLEAHKQAAVSLAARLTELDAEAAGRSFTDEQRQEFEEISAPETGLLARVQAAVDELEIREQTIAGIVGAGGRGVESTTFSAPNIRRVPDDPFDLVAYRQRVRSIDDLPQAYRDGAMRVLEGAVFPTALAAGSDPEKQRARVAQLIERHAKERNGWISAHVIGTSSPAYVEAYAQAMSGQPVSPRMMAVLQTYVDADGGFAIPTIIDPTFINTSDGSVNPIRRISRIETTVGKDWRAITTAGVVAAYVGERTTTGAADGAPTDVDDPTVTPVRADVSVDASLEYLQDYGSTALLAELGTLIQVAKDDLEAVKFFLGDGTGEPEGIVFAIDADAGSLVATITDDVYALEDIDKLIGQLGARFRSRAEFVANLAILQLSRDFGTAGQTAGTIYDPISKTLRGYAASEASAMDDVATNAKEILLFGDFSKFVVVDKLGLYSKVLDSRDTNGRPTGNSTIYAAWRNSTKVLVLNAFRLLKVQ
jgi:HK97 family phage major capsid protein